MNDTPQAESLLEAVPLEKSREQRLKQHFYECVMMGYIGTAIGYFALAVMGANLLHDAAVFVSNLLLIIFLVLVVSVLVATLSWIAIEYTPKPRAQPAESEASNA